MTFQSAEDPVTKAPIAFTFDSSDFRMLEPGEQLFKLAAKKRVKELYEVAEGNGEDGIGVNKEKIKEEIEKLSVKYQVLTGETAFVGIIKQDSKPTGEMIKVTIPTTTPSIVKPPSFSSWGAPGSIGGGGGAVRMRCSATLASSSSSSMMKKCKTSAMPATRMARAAPEMTLSKPSSSISSSLSTASYSMQCEGMSMAPPSRGMKMEAAAPMKEKMMERKK